MITFRPAAPGDADAVSRLWAVSNAARRADLGSPLEPPAGPAQRSAERQLHERLSAPGAFAVLAEQDGELAAIALALQALAQDGASDEPIPGLAHISTVAVRPDLWGQRLGAEVLARVLHAARNRGFTSAQLWTHDTNLRAQRLYERTGWTASGETKTDEFGEPIRHYTQTLA